MLMKMNKNVCFQTKKIIEKKNGFVSKNSDLPPHPSEWPQAPIMVCPTPGTSTIIRNVRYVNDENIDHFSKCSKNIVPVNNGTEEDGKSIIIEFESKYFVGTMLMRIKDICQWNKKKVNDGSNNKNYFDGRKRRFQAIVRGTFKVPNIRMSDCYTGQIFSKPADNLPPKFITKSFLLFVKTLAPQLDAKIDCNEPRFLSPLIATAQTVLVHNNKNSTSIEKEIEEPYANNEMSIMSQVLNKKQQQQRRNNNIQQKKDIQTRMKDRKLLFNTLSSSKELNDYYFNIDKVYTFEFYQHMIVFNKKDDLFVQFGKMGNIPVSPITNGQPIKFASYIKNQNDTIISDLWSFDIWHESMYPFALRGAASGSKTL